MLRQITFFRVSRDPKQCIGIFKVSNEWTCETRCWKKCGGQEAESPNSVWKEWACLLHVGSFWSFWSHCPSKKRGKSRPYTHGLKMATLLQWTSLVKIGKIFSGSCIGFEVWIAFLGLMMSKRAKYLVQAVSSFQPSSPGLRLSMPSLWFSRNLRVTVFWLLGGWEPGQGAEHSYCMQGISWELTDLKRLGQVGLWFSTKSPKCRKTRAHVKGCSQPSIPFYQMSDRGS